MIVYVDFNKGFAYSNAWLFKTHRVTFFLFVQFMEGKSYLYKEAKINSNKDMHAETFKGNVCSQFLILSNKSLKKEVQINSKICNLTKYKNARVQQCGSNGRAQVLHI